MWMFLLGVVVGAVGMFVGMFWIGARWDGTLEKDTAANQRWH